MIEEKPYNAIFSRDGNVIGIGDNVLSAERSAVKFFKNGFTIQELYLSGCYCKAISLKEYTRLINKNNCDLRLFMRL